MDAKFSWSLLDAKGARPSPRNGHAIASVSNVAYMFGGTGLNESEGEPIYFSDFYKLELGFTPTWKLIPPKGDVPCGRDGHSLTAVGNLLYLFGGSADADSEECLNDMYCFDPALGSWRLLDPAGAPPLPRSNHAAASVGSAIFIFGGFVEGEATNDIHIFDTVTCTWSTPQTIDKPPPPRCDHSLTPVDRKLYVFGGSGGEDVWLNDVYIFDCVTLAWGQPAINGSAPSKRDYHTAVPIATGDVPSIVIFGGLSGAAENYANFNDVHRLNLATMTWEHIRPSGLPPKARHGHSSFAFQGKMYSFAGSDEEGDLSDVWVLDITTGGVNQTAAAIGASISASLNRQAGGKSPARDNGTPITGSNTASHSSLGPESAQADGRSPSPRPLSRSRQASSSSGGSGVFPASIEGISSMLNTSSSTAFGPSSATQQQQQQQQLVQTPTQFQQQRRGSALAVRTSSVSSSSPGQPEKRDYEDLQMSITKRIFDIFDELRAESAALDAERLAIASKRSELIQDREAMEEEVREARAELSALAEKHAADNESWLAAQNELLAIERTKIAAEWDEVRAAREQLAAEKEAFTETSRRVNEVLKQFQGIAGVQP